jgi:hypothetical protein
LVMGWESESFCLLVMRWESESVCLLVMRWESESVCLLVMRWESESFCLLVMRWESESVCLLVMRWESESFCLLVVRWESESVCLLVMRWESESVCLLVVRWESESVTFNSVSHRPVTTETWIRSRASPCEICGCRIDTDNCSYPSSWASPCHCHSTIAPTRVTSDPILVSLQKSGTLWHVWEPLTKTSTLTLYHMITEH